MAHKKGQSSSKNGRESQSKRLGLKKFGGEVVAQIHQRGTDVGKLALAGTHDVGKLRDGRRSLVRAQILAGIAQVDHDAGEVGKMFRSHAQLTARWP